MNQTTNTFLSFKPTNHKPRHSFIRLKRLKIARDLINFKEIPPHFIHERKTKVYEVITVNTFLHQKKERKGKKRDSSTQKDDSVIPSLQYY